MPLEDKLCACEKKIVKVTCPHCGIHFCEDCDQLAHNIPSLKIHKRFPYLGVEASKYCALPDHEGNLLTLFCQDCSSPICGGVCAHIEHKGHNFIPIKKAIQEMKTKLEQSEKPYQEKIINLEAEIKEKEKELKEARLSIEAIKNLLTHSDKGCAFVSLVLESKVWKTLIEPEKKSQVHKQAAGELEYEWYYKDLKGNVQGPHTSTDMRDWTEDGYFELAMELIKVPKGSAEPTYFTTLRKLITNGQNPFITN